MAGTISVGRTNNQDTDGLLVGGRWDTTNLTYSFTTSSAFYGTGYGFGEPYTGFETLNATQQSAVNTILTMCASVINLAFTQTTESATDHAVLRLAMTDDPNVGTAVGYYPNAAETGGDSWYRNAGGIYHNPVRGNYAYHTFMHELGHNLGLKHGQDTSAYGAMTAPHDSMEYSVMTYRSYVGAPLVGGYGNETWGYAQTLMMHDIAALQHMYGADFTTNSGNSTYSWDANTGQTFINGVGQGAPGGNRIFMTIWDGGGSDTYDLSNYETDVTVDLRPGEWTTTSAVQRANLGDGNFARGNVANALLYNGDTQSLIENAIGGSADDFLYGNTASNFLDGRGGSDTIVLAGVQSDYTFSGAATNFTATGFAATDTILNVEFVRFLGSTMTVAVASLLTTVPDDYRDSTTDTTAPLCLVSVGKPARSGRIEALGDADIFRVTLEAGEIYRFDLRGTDSAGGTLADPYLFLRNNAGAVVAQDDDAGTGFDSQITFTATTSATYYADAQSFDNNATGTYTLSNVLI